MSAGHARRAIDTARKLDTLPELAEAFAAGDVSRAHVEMVTDAHTPERAEMLRGVEHELVDYARVATPPSCVARCGGSPTRSTATTAPEPTKPNTPRTR